MSHPLNPWQSEAGPISSLPPLPGLLVQRFEGVIPLDRQIGVIPKRSVPNVIHGALFGEPLSVKSDSETSAAPLQSYAVLDAAKLPALIETVERNRLESRCLFKGHAGQELGSVAPWIVRLDEESTFTRNLFTKGAAPWQLWDKAPGIYLRSRCCIDELQAHLRHFTRLQNDQGGWFYFRFWEPAVAATYFPTLAQRLEIGRRWFHPRQGPRIEGMLILDVSRDTGTATFIQPVGLEQVADIAGNALLRAEDIALLSAARIEADVTALTKELGNTFGNDLPLSGQALVDMVRTALDGFMKLGFRQRDNLFVMLAWEAFFGPGFEKLDTDGQLARIMRSDRDEAERFDLLKRRMQKLS